jgi:hypothetical protein
VSRFEKLTEVEHAQAAAGLEQAIESSVFFIKFLQDTMLELPNEMQQYDKRTRIQALAAVVAVEPPPEILPLMVAVAVERLVELELRLEQMK